MNKRPVNLNLFTIRFPITAISSILHRITGVLLFIGIPVFLIALQQSLGSAEGFEHFANLKESLVCSITAWVLISALGYHVIAGIRHLLMDLHIGEGKCSGKMGAWITLILSAVFCVFMGAKLLW